MTLDIRRSTQAVAAASVAATQVSRGRTEFTLEAPMPCPCCAQPVFAPSIEIIIDRFDLTPIQARILEAVWKGRGLPVMTDRIFDLMYRDDPDGGPSPIRMYRTFVENLSRMKARLRGSGISIENAGYRQGYRLVIGDY